MTDERRATPRVDVETFVKDFFGESEPEAGSGIIFRLVTNVSETGAFVVDRLHSLDTVCKLELPIPDDGTPLAVEAEVVRRTPDGAAVRFLAVTDADRARIAKLARS